MTSEREKPTGKARGGYARAEKLSAEERSEIAKKGAAARWGGDEIPRATHIGELEISGRKLACAVLEDGRRMLSQSTFLTAIGRSPKGKGGQVAISADGLPPFLAAKGLTPYISSELREATVPVQYRSVSGRKMHGYSAEILPMVCEVYLAARDDDATTDQQARVVQACDLLMRGLARVGIIALVDEATGYQEVRDRKALQAILDKYLTDEYAKWTKTFSDDFYKELFRLKGIMYPGTGAVKPSYVGHWTNNVVYARLAPGVKRELQKKNPRQSSGHRRRKHHQHLTRDHGHPALKEHLSNVTFLMKACASWDEFAERLDRVSPKFGDTMPLPFDANAKGDN